MNSEAGEKRKSYVIVMTGPNEYSKLSALGAQNFWVLDILIVFRLDDNWFIVLLLFKIRVVSHICTGKKKEFTQEKDLTFWVLFVLISFPIHSTFYIVMIALFLFFLLIFFIYVE